jgi:hypothetical protein
LKNVTRPYGYKIPVDTKKSHGKIAHGFLTPPQDLIPQVQCIVPKRVLPIIFIPGIMGSNLRVNLARQSLLGLDNNIAWRPDNKSVTLAQHNDTRRERQLRLDFMNTEVDSYDPINNPTGDALETSDERNESVVYSSGYRGFGRLDGPLLQSDDPRINGARTKDQKARERGWGEVFFGSYQEILSTCESRINSAFSQGSIDIFLKKFVVEKSPSIWEADAGIPMEKLSEEAIREAVIGCWFPVHAMGYNWLKGNAISAIKIAARISDLISSYKSQGFNCEKVILVTHSMGGLVARGVIHPKIGGINEKVLGIVHGVMPAVGAGVAYKRMRCGVEGSGVAGGIAASVLGNNAAQVTAVLADAQGALELLPNRMYGQKWLELRQKEKVIQSWPEKCPYEEIYKVRGKWFSLFSEDLINPAEIDFRGFDFTVGLLNSAKNFHELIEDTYHPQSFAHYGADKERKACYKVVWHIASVAQIENPEFLSLVKDNFTGRLVLEESNSGEGDHARSFVEIEILEAADPGDQTVPVYSADAQLRSKKFKGIFRQSGYEHQASYSNSKVVAATLYSLFKIIQTMKWSA